MKKIFSSQKKQKLEGTTSQFTPMMINVMAGT
jgi:hypothetical protein